MSTFYVAVKTREGMKHYEVPNDVYVYIRQLEECIKHPELSKIKEAYPERFNSASSTG